MNSASIMSIVVYFVFIFGIFYFIGIRPQKKEQKKQLEMIAALAIGDYVKTTSGFYGQIIDITDDMVIVEFGNKNCRIPMVKAAIAEIEKQNVSSAPTETKVNGK